MKLLLECFHVAYILIRPQIEIMSWRTFRKGQVNIYIKHLKMSLALKSLQQAFWYVKYGISIPFH